MTPIYPLISSQIDRGAVVLARAFHADPAFTCAIADQARRARVLPWFFGTVLRYGLLHDLVETTPEVDGVAVWLRPGRTTMRLGGVLRAGMWRAMLQFSPAELWRFVRQSSCEDRLHRRAIGGPHWYLFALGVEPARQGQGIGSALIQAGVARADADGLPCYLETVTGRNVRFYAQHGFRVATHGHLPAGGPPVWTMVRL
jgi:ribosomal protein S18 acetylase RimI-like enzyme